MGGQSRALENLFTGPARLWNAATPAVDLPVFNAGRVRSNVRLTEAQQREALATYRKTIETAFREVSDSLIGYRKTSEQRAQEELLLKALRETSRLSTLRYQGGLDSYLQVLDAERNLFPGRTGAGAIAGAGSAVSCATLPRARRRLAVIVRAAITARRGRGRRRLRRIDTRATRPFDRGARRRRVCGART